LGSQAKCISVPFANNYASVGGLDQMLQGDSNSFVSCFNWLKYNTLFSAVILECDMVMSLSSVSQHLISKTMDYFSTTLVLFQKGEVTLEALSQIRASVKQRS